MLFGNSCGYSNSSDNSNTWWIVIIAVIVLYFLFFDRSSEGECCDPCHRNSCC